jgi:hypothetical protein
MTGFSLDALKRINGNQSDEFQEAKEGCDGIKKQASALAGKLTDYENGIRLLNTAASIEIRDIVISLAHLREIAKELSEFHARGKLFEYFKDAYTATEKQYEKAHSTALRLLDVITENDPLN